MIHPKSIFDFLIGELGHVTADAIAEWNSIVGMRLYHPVATFFLLGMAGLYIPHPTWQLWVIVIYCVLQLYISVSNHTAYAEMVADTFAFRMLTPPQDLREVVACLGEVWGTVNGASSFRDSRVRFTRLHMMRINLTRVLAGKRPIDPVRLERPTSIAFSGFLAWQAAHTSPPTTLVLVLLFLSVLVIQSVQFKLTARVAGLEKQLEWLVIMNSTGPDGKPLSVDEIAAITPSAEAVRSKSEEGLKQ